ncbi:E3 ubiquitin-protein ligase SDIR1 [Quillaja saponaria]|uniref:RING-type E3 ubiquitin transferase n=1 Tax=Quillaja saponaria TaxID=32244 RepID=A0AAD7LLM4_QUISA|nr:E3 ubiquitin-protein ligase SDIR1 [Quillaja saponaria]
MNVCLILLIHQSVHTARPVNSNSLTFLVTDYETLRALDQINALPVHKHKVACPQNAGSSMQQGSSSASSEKQHDTSNAVGNMKASEHELTCSVCLEQVNIGELLHSLPCLHQGSINDCSRCFSNSGFYCGF